jgi:hypothetical protein
VLHQVLVCVGVRRCASVCVGVCGCVRCWLVLASNTTGVGHGGCTRRQAAVACDTVLCIATQCLLAWVWAWVHAPAAKLQVGQLAACDRPGCGHCVLLCGAGAKCCLACPRFVLYTPQRRLRVAG